MLLAESLRESLILDRIAEPVAWLAKLEFGVSEGVFQVKGKAGGAHGSV